VDVVGHDNELVEEIFLLFAIVHKGVDQKSCSCFTGGRLETLGGDGSDKEDAVGVHSVIVGR